MSSLLRTQARAQSAWRRKTYDVNGRKVPRWRAQGSTPPAGSFSTANHDRTDWGNVMRLRKARVTLTQRDVRATKSTPRGKRDA